MKKKPISVVIPKPCHENRDDMTNVQGGKFCTSCNKTVIDFTTWSDTALYDYFSKNKTGVCGSFLATQLQRSLPVPVSGRSAFYRLATAVGLTILLAQYPEGKGFAKSPYSYSAPLPYEAYPIPVDTTGLRGYVTSQNIPVKKAVIQLFREGRLITETKADTAGYYYIPVAEAGKYKLVVSKLFTGEDSPLATSLTGYWVEYETKEVEVVIIEQKVNIENIFLGQMVHNIIPIVSGAPMLAPEQLLQPAYLKVNIGKNAHRHKKTSKK